MKKINIKVLDKVEIEWIDSMRDEDGWIFVNSIDFERRSYEALHKTIAYYLREVNNVIFVCMSYRKTGDDDISIENLFAIPHVAVVNLHKL